MNRNLPIYMSAIILAIATIFFIIRGNYEFLSYAVTLFILIWIVLKTDRIFNYPSLAKWGFMVWMLMHMAGGSLYFGGTRLYELILINIIGEPFNILRYDQVVHAFCYFVMGLLAYSVVIYLAKPNPKQKTSKTSNAVIYIVAFLTAIGIGALNEIIEFSTVAFFGSTGVGNYYNNALDLVFNAIGAIVALIIAGRIKR